ncbi:MAG TPA: glycosyltransferase, partial [Coleofasciculaceae cyanobacterium]
MKIAFLVGEFPSLSETFVLDQITSLIDRGHEVDIYASPSDMDTTKKIHLDIEKYQLLQRTYYHPPIPGDYLIRFLKGLILLLTYLPNYSNTLLKSFNFSKFGKQVLSLRLLYNIIPFLKPNPQYDIIFCHFGPNGVRGHIMRDLGLIQGKLCTVFHGFDLTGYLQQEGDHAYDELFQQGDLFLPISDRWKQKLIDLGCPPEKIQVHHMGIDCDKFTFAPRQLSADGVIQIITVCRLVEKKGVEYAIRAVAQIKDRYPKIQYTIIGDGPLKPELEKLVSELKISDTVHLVGWKQRNEVIEILNQSQIFLAPSVTACNGDQEGIPVALMEAMAMGMPVISTFHSGIPELIEDGYSGYLVPERDVDGLADRILTLIHHPELWSKLEKAGRWQVEKEFNNKKLSVRLCEIYENLVDA